MKSINSIHSFLLVITMLLMACSSSSETGNDSAAKNSTLAGT